MIQKKISLLLAAVFLLGILSSCVDTPPAPTEETAPANPYLEEAFYREDGFLRYSDAEHLVGIDVSTHQGLIDWQQVAQAGVQFAIIRAGYRGSTVGELYEDEQFRYNLTEARAAGLKVGVYFFSQAVNEADAREEADYVCNLLEGEKLDLPVFFDWETVDGSDRVSHPSEIDMTACTIAFCEQVKSAGFDPGVYFNQTYGNHYLELAALQDYMLWLAEYNETPSFPYAFDCLQYTDSGSVTGIEGGVDLDLLILKGGDAS